MKKLFLLITCLSALVINAKAQDIVIDETTFPNSYFRSWILEQTYGQDGVLTQEEISGVTHMLISADRNCTDFTGLEHFTALKSIGANYAYNLLSLNCSTLTNLEILDFKYVSIRWDGTTPDFSGCTRLKTLRLNQCYWLDITNNTDLEELQCRYLRDVDLTNNTKLRIINLSSLEVTTPIDFSIFTNLEELSLESSYRLTNIDLSHNTELTKLKLSSCSLTSIDLSHNTKLTLLYLDNNNLKSLDLSALPLLSEVNIRRQKNISIDGLELNSERTKIYIPFLHYATENDVNLLKTTMQQNLYNTSNKTIATLTWETINGEECLIIDDNIDHDFYPNSTVIYFTQIVPTHPSAPISSSSCKLDIRMQPASNSFYLYINPNSYSTRGNYYCGTFAPPSVLIVPEGIELYSITGLQSSAIEISKNGEKHVFEQFVMEKNAGVGDKIIVDTDDNYFVKAQAPGLYQFVQEDWNYYTTYIHSSAGNLLSKMGNYDTSFEWVQSDTHSILTLGREKTTGEIGFWQHENIDNTERDNKYNMYRCFIKSSILAETNGANGAVISFDNINDEPNTIEQISENTDNEEFWYTMSGIRLTKKPTTKGIYIVNGKKVSIK